MKLFSKTNIISVMEYLFSNEVLSINLKNIYTLYADFHE